VDDTRSLYQLIHRSRRRTALSAAIKSAMNMVVWGAVAALLLLICIKIVGLSRNMALIAFAAIPVSVIAGFIRGWKHSFCSDYAAAKQLDRELKLHDRLANTFYFLSQDASKRSPLAELAIADGLNAARTAKLGAMPKLQWTRHATYGVLASLLCAGAVFFINPPTIIPPDQAIAKETQEENKEMIKGFQDLPGATAEQKDDIKKMLDSLNISEDEMSKMTKADLMRRISSKVGEYKGGNAKGFEMLQGAIGELDAIRVQQAEIEKKNKEAYSFKGSDGKTLAITRIQTKAPNESVVRSRIEASMGIKQAGESEDLIEMQNRTDLLEKESKKARGAVGLKQKTTGTVDTGALLATDEKYKKDRDEAITDPNGAAAARVKAMQRDVMRREIEKGDLPEATAEALKNLMSLEK
jgi:hypothetical protein